jgi:hypothetical protein
VLHALLKKKLRVVEPTIEYRDVEDHLTAAVLERISYLSLNVAASLIEASIVEQRFGRFTTPKADEGDEDLWVEFWPRFTDPTSSQLIVEPDAILGIGNHVYVVEAKRTDEWGQTAEQAARDWLSFYTDEDEERDDIEEDGARTLLLLGGVADAGRFSILAEAIKQRILNPKGDDAEGEKAEGKSALIPRIAWVSWTKFASTVSDFIQTATPQEARILEDINLALTYHGFGAWITFTQLSRIVETRVIRLGAESLPTSWPSAPELTPRSDPLPDVPLPNPIDEWRRLSLTVRIEATPSQFSVFSEQV